MSDQSDWRDRAKTAQRLLDQLTLETELSNKIADLREAIAACQRREADANRQAEELRERLHIAVSAGTQLQARLDAAEKDAARYRWLRSQDFGFAYDRQHCGVSTSAWGDWPKSDFERDVMIDAARADAITPTVSADEKGESQ